MPDRLGRRARRQRRDRTARLTRLARQSTRLWHPAGEAAKARNALLAGLTESELHDQVAWMHGARHFGTARHFGGPDDGGQQVARPT